MNYAVDSCVGLKWFLSESDSAKALRLRDDYRNAVHELLAPDVFPVEITHALTRAERQGRINPSEGLTHFQDMLAVLPILHNSLSLLPRTYAISSQTRVGVYDCLNVALAQRKDIEFVPAGAARMMSQQALLLTLGKQICPINGGCLFPLDGIGCDD